MSSSRARGPQRPLWWLTPPGLILGFLLPIFLMIILLGEIHSPALTIRGIRFMTTEYGLMGIGYLAVLALAAHVGSHIDLKTHGPVHERPWTGPAMVVGLVALAAYLFWFKEFLINPGLLWQAFTQSGSVSRADIGQTVGVTSLTNLTPAFFCLVAHVWVSQPRSVPAPLKVLAGVLAFLTVFRVYVWAERLALVEALVATALPLVSVVYQRHRSPVLRTLLMLLPVLGLPLLLLYFGVAEYYRSWQSDTYQASNLGFWEFAAGRLAAYYYTSLNNGAGVLETQAWPTYRMENILQFLHKAPLLVGPIFQYYTDAKAELFGSFLKNFADPEFNNPSGIYIVLYDVGYGGAVIYFALIGFLAGLLGKAFHKGQLRGVLIYPFMTVTMLEIYRYPYLGSSRAFTIFLGIGLLILAISASRVKPAPGFVNLKRT